MSGEMGDAEVFLHLLVSSTDNFPLLEIHQRGQRREQEDGEDAGENDEPFHNARRPASTRRPRATRKILPASPTALFSRQSPALPRQARCEVERRRGGGRETKLQTRMARADIDRADFCYEAVIR